MARFINEDLIGKAGGAAELTTPALVIDLAVFERNLNAMAEQCKRAGLSLRPHAKTHKCAEIARRQIAAGAVGICCAKLGEAEALAEAGGIENILITSPVVTKRGIARLMALHEKIADLHVVADHPENVKALAEGASNASKPLKVLVDLDIGLHRTGIAPEGALELAQHIAAASALTFMGLQAYGGHLMHIEKFAERREKSLAAMAVMKGVKEAIEGKGIACPILSGGGTGTADIDPEAKVLTELQGGSYIFMDKQYNDIEGAQGRPLFGTSLYVQMSVVSKNTPRLVTTDAGFKSFATDAEPPVLLDGAPEGAGYFFFGDEQGGILLPEGADLPLGSTLTAITPHCDPTVNLYDCYHVVENGTLTAIWPIEARGRSA